MTQNEFKILLHPSEASRYLLALLVVVPLATVGVVIVFWTNGFGLLAIPLILFGSRFATGLTRASFLGSAVRVSETNFPEIHQAVLDAKKELSYSGAVDVFVYAEGEINAFLLSLFRRKLVLIPAGAVSQRWVAADNEVKWLIARFIGALKSKHHRINILRVLIDSSEKLMLLNLLFYPYERATQYSGDQIGLAVTRDLSAALRMTTKFFVGKDVVDRVNIRGLIAQADEIHGSFFGLLTRLFSPFPHLADRYLNLLDFARSRHPAAFNEYLSHYDEATRSEILAILPNVHAPLGSPPSSIEPARVAGAAD